MGGPWTGVLPKKILGKKILKPAGSEMLFYAFFFRILRKKINFGKGQECCGITKTTFHFYPTAVDHTLTPCSIFSYRLCQTVLRQTQSRFNHVLKKCVFTELFFTTYTGIFFAKSIRLGNQSGQFFYTRQLALNENPKLMLLALADDISMFVKSSLEAPQKL